MSDYPVQDQVILASAGSGKTFALSDRIVKLLASVMQRTLRTSGAETLSASTRSMTL